MTHDLLQVKRTDAEKGQRFHGESVCTCGWTSGVQVDQEEARKAFRDHYRDTVGPYMKHSYLDHYTFDSHFGRGQRVPAREANCVLCGSER